ncbi:MAG: F0F1 ATP synthase subunit B' [Pseudomonadota bacterium]
MAAENGGDGGGGLPQLNFETWPSQILWLAISITALYFILSRFVLPRVAATIEERRDTIASDLDLAADFERKARDAEKSYKQALEDARAEARGIADKNQAEIREKLNVAIAEADKRISEQADESAKRIGNIQAEAREKAAEVAESTAMALVAKFNPSGDVDAAVVKAAVAKAVEARFGA